MTSLLDTIRKTLEEGYDIVKDGAVNIIEKAEDFGKINMHKFEIRQMSSSMEKKLTVLGDTVLPYLMKGNIEKAAEDEKIKGIVKDIQDFNKQIDTKHKDIDKILTENAKILKEKETDKVQKKIEELEQEIEDRLAVLNKLKDDK
jgi:peptidoglycan hydrolase CwlO-like protein